MGGGLTRFNGMDWTFFDSSNSPLPSFGATEELKIDENNQIWIASNDRLIQFDGVNWIVYPDSFVSRISSLAIGPDNTVWIGFDFSLVLVEYNTADSTFVGHDLQEETELPGRGVRALLRDSDFLWIGTDIGLVNYDGSSWTVYDSSDFGLRNSYDSALALDNDGNLLVGGYGLASFDGQNWQSYDELNSELLNYPLTSLLVDSEKNIWFAGEGSLSNEGFVKFDGENWQIFNTINSGLSENAVTSLAIDENGNLWLGTLNHGIDIYREGGLSGNFEAYSRAPYSQQQTHIPERAKFCNVYPNPFNRYTTIRIDLERDTFVKGKVFDVLGREVTTLINGSKQAGSHYTSFDGQELATGVYFLQIQAGGEVSVQKMLLVK